LLNAVDLNIPNMLETGVVNIVQDHRAVSRWALSTQAQNNDWSWEWAWIVCR